MLLFFSSEYDGLSQSARRVSVLRNFVTAGRAISLQHILAEINWAMSLRFTNRLFFVLFFLLWFAKSKQSKTLPLNPTFSKTE